MTATTSSATTSSGTTGSRLAGRAASTRTALLGSARTVFTSSGFAEASIADVVAGAGASVGSLYHHFGGKAELYLALFVAGSRAYLDGCWAERDLARLFLAGGGPPGFELVARRRYREWTARNATLLSQGPDDGVEPWGDALVLVLTTVVSEAGHEVAVCEDETTAHRLAGDVLALIGRIGGSPP